MHRATPGGKRTYELPHWRFRDVLLALGTANEIRAKLIDKGYEAPPRESIQGWRNRNSIPANWIPVLMQMMLDERYVDNIEKLRI